MHHLVMQVGLLVVFLRLFILFVLSISTDFIYSSISKKHISVLLGAFLSPGLSLANGSATYIAPECFLAFPLVVL